MDLGYPVSAIDQSLLSNIGKIIENLIHERLNHFPRTEQSFLCPSIEFLLERLHQCFTNVHNKEYPRRLR